MSYESFRADFMSRLANLFPSDQLGSILATLDSVTKLRISVLYVIILSEVIIMNTKPRKLTDEERNGNFHFTAEELKNKTIIQATAERCFQGILYDIDASISEQTAHQK